MSGLPPEFPLLLEMSIRVPVLDHSPDLLAVTQFDSQMRGIANTRGKRVLWGVQNKSAYVCALT